MAEGEFGAAEVVGSMVTGVSRLAWLAAVTVACGGSEGAMMPLADPAGYVGELEEIPNLVELPGGRIAFAQPADRAVVILDLSTRAMRRVGSAGKGPGEFIQPTRLYRFRDRLLVLDAAQSRLAHFTTDGDHLADSIIRRPLRSGFELSPDGRFFIAAPQPDPKAGESVVSVGWFDPSRARFTPVTALKVPPRVPVDGAGGSITSIPLFAPFDAAGLSSSGAVWIARAEPQRVEWISVENHEMSPPLEIELIPASPDEQRVERWRGRDFRIPMASPKGPFEAAVPGPEDEVWLQLAAPHLAPTTTLLQVRRGSRALRRFTIPNGRKVRFITEDWIFSTLEDADGFTILEWRARPDGG